MFLLKKTHKRRIAELKQEYEARIVRIQETCAKEITKQIEKRSEIEAKIIEAQEKNEKVFYQKEKDLKEQVELGIIDSKEFYYSQRLLLEIEKALK